MKKIYLKNSLALLLTGTMLAGVGCKDYDDDIDNLQKEVDDLKGQIELKADASAVSSLQQKLEGINFDDFVKEAELNDLVKGLGYQTAEDVKALIPEGMSEEDVKDIFDAQIKALDTWGEIETNIGKAVKEYLASGEYTAAEQAEIVNTILDQLTEDPQVKDIKTAIKNLLGENFGEYLNQYKTTDDFVGAIDEAAAAALKKENSVLAAAIMEKIDPEGFLENKDLSAIFQEYDQKISAIWDAIDDLAGRIQSIVFVPTKVNDGGVDVSMGGYYIAASKAEDNIQLASQPKVKVAFRVAPAALAETLAKKINEGEVKASFIPEVVTRAAEAPVTYEGDVLAEDGKLIFTAVANSEVYAKLDRDETFAVALCLSQEAKKDDKGNYETLGFEITSPYITTDGDSNSVESNFVLAHEVDGKLVAYAYKPIAYELPWNSEESITLLEDYVLGYQEGYGSDAKILTMEEAAKAYLWDEGVAEKLGFKYEHTAITYQKQGMGADIYATQTQLTVTPAKVTDKANVNAPVTVANSAKKDIANVGDMLTLTDKVWITDGEKEIAFNVPTVKSTVTILGDLLKTMNIDLNFVWKYTNYAFNAYEAEITIPAEDHMNWEKFNQLPDSFTVSLTLPEKSEVATNGSAITLTFERKEMLNAESAQQFVVTAANYVTGDGEAEYETEVNLRDDSDAELNTYVAFNGKVTFKGLPAMNFEVKNSNIAKVNADYSVTLDGKFNETLYAQAQDYFDKAEEVTTFLTNLTMNYNGVKQAADLDATPMIPAVDPNIESGKLFKLWFNSSGFNWEKQPSYMYTVPTGEDKGVIIGMKGNAEVFMLNLTGSYELTNTIYKLQPNSAYLYDGVGGANPYIYINGGVEGNAFNLANINLTNAYTVSEEAAKAGATQTFELVTKTPEGYGSNTLPTIASGVMNWNNCILDKVTMKTTLYNDKTEVLDTKVFDVVLKEPIAFDSWKFYGGSKIEVSTTKEATFNLQEKVLAATSTGSTYGTIVAIDIYGNALYKSGVLTKLASEDAGYDIEVSYGNVVWTNATETIEGVTVKDGVITVPKGNEQLAKEITGTVKVTYTYKYAWVPVEKNGKVTGYERKKFSFDIPVAFKNAPAIEK